MEKKKQAAEEWEKDAKKHGDWNENYPSLMTYPIGPTQINKYDPFSIKAAIDDEIVDVSISLNFIL